jgi:hypothetical protein
MKINNPGLSTIVIDNLAAGTYEFAMTSYNLDGVESAPSNKIMRIVGTGAVVVEDAGATMEALENVAVDGEPDAATATSNTTPFLMISGTPPEAVTAGALYLFTPTVESNGESPPAFAIDGLPHWAGFDEITGELYGTPDVVHIGLYEAITIWATDGVVETSLPSDSARCRPGCRDAELDASHAERGWQLSHRPRGLLDLLGQQPRYLHQLDANR